MHTLKFHTAAILKDMKERLSEVCPNVFVGGRPTSTKEEMKEFLVVSMPYSVRDKGAWQNTYFRVEIYVKDKSQGVQNIARLDALSNKLVSLFPMVGLKGRYKASKPFLNLTGRDGLGFTVWNLQNTLLVNTSDSY